MIKACMNMSCCQQGADLSYLKLHAAMQLHMQYYIKHAIGILTQYKQHSDRDPWFGASQGAGDACLQWVVQANSMILAYESIATPWVVHVGFSTVTHVPSKAYHRPRDIS